MSHVFISYSKKNVEYARRLTDRLLQQGFNVWIDSQIDTGADWWRTIVRALRSARAFIVIMSEEADSSEWVQREVTLADKQKLPAFPLWYSGDVEASENWAIYVRTQYVDVRNGQLPDDEFFNRLAKFVPRRTRRGEEVTAVALAERNDHQLLQQTVLSIVKPVQSNRDWKPILHDFDGIQMALVPPGCFLMGSDDGANDEKPVHRQCFELPYWISRYPITNAQYQRAVEDGGCTPPKDREWYDNSSYSNHPVTFVTWFQARQFAQWCECTLPTEVEWEYAARGPDALIYTWGIDFNPTNLIYKANSSGGTAAVDRTQHANSWVAATDMNGNVAEWTSSIYKPFPYDYRDGREDYADDMSLRVLKGGSWWNEQPASLTSTFRQGYAPNYRNGYTGFRIVRNF